MEKGCEKYSEEPTKKCDTCLWAHEKEVIENELPRRCDWYEVCIYKPMEV